MTARATMQEFFAGSGLVSYGLRDMFDVVWANDISAEKAGVYTENFGDAHFHLGDIKTVRGTDIPKADISWASFPCQDLSLAGSIGGINAARSGLVWEWLRVLDEMQTPPKILVLENVIGLLTSHGGDDYRLLHEALMHRGFRSGPVVINADLFVPQSRPRVFVIAIDKRLDIPADMMSNGPTWLHNKAACDLGSTLNGWVWWSTPEPERTSVKLADVVEEDVPFRNMSSLRLIPKSHIEKAKASGLTYTTGYRRTRHHKQQLELRCDGIAGCLRTPGGGSSKQFVVKRSANGRFYMRLMTPREAARLMGAPDSFKLPKSYNAAYMAMGDAVAAPVATFLGERFLRRLVTVAYGY